MKFSKVVVDGCSSVVPSMSVNFSLILSGVQFEIVSIVKFCKHVPIYKAYFK
jgi:hypothetical protein